MDLRLLNTFLTIAKTGSFSKTAETLDYAQSSVTSQIQTLEERLGTKLFERLGRKVALTRAGEYLKVYAEKIVRLAQEAEDVIRNDIQRGTIVIGASESLCVYRLHPIISEFHRQYPQAQLIIKPGICYQLHEACHEGTVNLIFTVEKTIMDKSLISKQLAIEPMVLVTSPTNPLANKGTISVNDLSGQSLFVTELGCNYRKMLEDVLLEADIQPASLQEFGSLEAIKQCVLAGLGVTLLPKITVAKELSSGRLSKLNWVGPDFTIGTHMSYHKDKWISPIMKAFMELAEKFINENGH